MKKTIENFNVPEKREDRIKRLNEAVTILKSEFIGLDSIIDQVSKSVSPWYITPEIIRRPVVVSLWGMTGTGKTSLVKRLVDLLGLRGKTIFYDCGLEANDSSTSNIAENIDDIISGSEYEDGGSIDPNEKANSMVFVFDEFQYARTIDEAGCDDLKSPLRPVWSLLDDGILSLNNYRYEINQFKNFIEDFEVFVDESPENYNIKVTRGEVYDLESKKKLINGLGIFYFDEISIYDITGKSSKSSDKKKKSTTSIKKDSELSEDFINTTLTVFNSGTLRVIYKRINSYKAGLGSEIVKKIKTQELVLGDIIKELKRYVKMIAAPKTIDCSKSLVFILGNLDEAFVVGDEINPDVDADVFYDITSKVTVSDIKEALKFRFRPEQIARFGNNLIKYPTLNKEYFKRIIEKELNTIFSDFRNSDGIEVIYGNDILDLVYSESVYPVQGVRPIFTTIGSMITPLLSDIILGNEGDKNKTVKIKLKDQSIWKESEFKVPEAVLILEFVEIGKVIEKKIKLQLGELRDPETKKTRYINSVHEAGHAILFAYCTGKAPINIVSISSVSGGFCSVYNKDREGEIDCKDDIRKDVMTSLGGYEAERLVYGEVDEDKCLMGSGSDIIEAWNTLYQSAYKLGYFEPIRFSSRDTEIGVTIPSGFSDSMSLPPIGFGKGSKPDLQSRIIEEFIKLRKNTQQVLIEERKLLKELALYLGAKGSIKADKFLEFVGKYGNHLTLDYMKNTEEKDRNFYLDTLNNMRVDDEVEE